MTDDRLTADDWILNHQIARAEKAEAETEKLREALDRIDTDRDRLRRLLNDISDTKMFLTDREATDEDWFAEAADEVQL